MDYSYLVFLTISIAIYAIFALGLNLQWGFTGLINFGHVAFMNIGAYTSILLNGQGVPMLISTLIGAAFAAVLGLIVGLTTVRLREDYLSIVTIGVSEVLRLIALNEAWLTKGSFGIQGFPLPFENFRPNPFSRAVMISIISAIAIAGYWKLWQWAKPRLKQPQVLKDGRLWLSAIAAIVGFILYSSCAISLSRFIENPARNGVMLVSLVTLAIVFWRLEVLVHSPWGRVLKAIREDEEVARALGKNVFWYKLQALMLGGFIAGLSGTLMVWQLSSVFPDHFQPLKTFDAWTIVVLGGAGSNIGSILGSGLFWAYFTITRFLPDGLAWLHSVVPFVPSTIDQARLGAFRIMLIGLLLMILMRVRPQGLLGNKDELTLGQ